VNTAQQSILNGQFRPVEALLALTVLWGTHFSLSHQVQRAGLTGLIGND
jgi:hypothetical protein